MSRSLVGGRVAAVELPPLLSMWARWASLLQTSPLPGPHGTEWACVGLCVGNTVPTIYHRKGISKCRRNDNHGITSTKHFNSICTNCKCRSRSERRVFDTCTCTFMYAIRVTVCQNWACKSNPDSPMSTVKAGLATLRRFRSLAYCKKGKEHRGRPHSLHPLVQLFACSGRDPL